MPTRLLFGRLRTPSSPWAAVRLVVLAVLALGTGLFGAAPASRPAGPPATGPASELLIEVDGGKRVALTPGDFAKLPRESVRVKEHGGGEATYSGVPLAKVLELAGAPLAERLRGPNMATFVVAEGADGYKAVFSLIEADPQFGDRHIIVADRREGEPLSARAAPLQVIVPQDARQGRWVRNLVALRVRVAK